MTQQDLGEEYLGRQLADLAELKGYKYGVWIMSDGLPVQIGFGFIWSRLQKALVIGCLNKNGQYCSAVPVYNLETNTWATIVNEKDLE